MNQLFDEEDDREDDDALDELEEDRLDEDDDQQGLKYITEIRSKIFKK